MKTTTQKTNGGQPEIISLEDFRAFIRDELEMKVRGFGIEFVMRLMNEEIEQLCGPRGSHKKRGGLAHRGGSEVGWVALAGQRVQVRRPRARKDGEEVELSRYQALQSMDNLSDVVSRMMMYGISTRSYDRVLDKFDNDLGLSKSTVSRQYVRESRKSLNELNSRSFPGQIFWALAIDGVDFGGSTLIVALGVDTAGNKHILGISEGSTENADVCKSLLASLRERGIQFTEQIIAVMDGSKALHKGVKDVFGARVKFQRCLLHKRRNIEAKLEKKYHRELKTRMTQAYNCNKFEDAEVAFAGLLKWLDEISFSAARSLEEGLDELLTLHRIQMPPALRKSFYTTNLIESAFSTPRERTRRVKRWRKNTDQVLRWAGAQLLLQEGRFRKVRGYKEIPVFLYAFIEKPVAEKKAG